MGGAARIVLGLQGKAAVLAQGFAALARGGAVLQKVAGVQLDARLGGVQLHADAGLIAGSPCADALAGAAGTVDDIAVVVAAAHHGGLGEAGVDLLADGLTCGKVHGGVRHRQDVAGGAGGIVALQIAGSVDAQLLVQHIAAAVQIEVAVVGQVYKGVGVRGHPVVHAEGVVVGEGIAHRDLQRAGKAVLAVGAYGFHQQGVAEVFHLIDFPGKAAVQMVLAAVFFQLVGLAAQGKDGVFNAVGIAPHKSTAAGATGRGEVVFVICHGVVTQHHIHRAVFGRDDNIFDHAAVIQHADGHTAGVREDVLGNISALFGHTEGLGTDLCHWASPPKAFFGNAKGGRLPPLHLVCIYDYITVLQFCVGFILELPSNFSGDFLVESSKVTTMGLPPARLRRKNDFEYPPLTLWIFSAEGLF